jgi:hypothetical protein
MGCDHYAADGINRDHCRNPDRRDRTLAPFLS